MAAKNKNDRTYIKVSDEALSRFEMVARLAGDRFKWGDNHSRTKVMQHVLEEFSKNVSISDLQYLIDNGFEHLKIDRNVEKDS